MCHSSWPSLAQQFSCLIVVMPLSIALTHETLTCENVQFLLLFKLLIHRQIRSENVV